MTTTITTTGAGLGVPITCPTWCTASPDDSSRHTPDDLVSTELTVDADGTLHHEVVVQHPGPTWGAFSALAEVNHVTGETIPEVHSDESAVLNDYGIINGMASLQALRRLAADAQAAAEWLEERRSA